MLTKKEKEVTWKHFLHLLRPDEEDRVEIVITEEDDFDPDKDTHQEEESVISE